MQVFGFTLNLLTLLAIVLSVGLVVDDAIVVVENVERHIRGGQDAAARRRSSARASWSGPIIAMTITLAAVYAPIGFQGGLTGALFREFAFTLAGAVFISGVVALTLSPMMSSRLLTPHARRSWLAATDRPRLRAHQAHLRARARRDAPRRARRSTRSGSSSTLVVVPMYLFSPNELAPNEDQGVIFGAIDVPAERHASSSSCPTPTQIEQNFAAVPEFDHSFQITFPTGGFGGILRQALGRAEADIFAIQEELTAEARQHHGHPRAGVPAVGAAQRAGSSRSSSSSRRRRATRSSCASRSSSCRRR